MKSATLFVACLWVLILIVIFSFVGCKAAGDISDRVNSVGKSVEQFATDNPPLDDLTGGGVSAIALLIYSIAATIGLFRERKKRNESDTAIRAIIDDPSNPVTVDTSPITVRQTVRKALQ